MRHGTPLIAGAALAGLLASPPLPAAAEETDGRAALRTVEGAVGAVERLPAGSDGGMMAVRLQVEEGAGPRELEVLLAPERALSESGFEVAAGDRLRARVFLSDGGAVEAHKVMNLSRGTLVRLRTLRRVPLWDASGRWQGGPCRTPGEGHGPYRRHGGPGGPR